MSALIPPATVSAIGIFGTLPRAISNQEYEKRFRGNLEHPWIFLSCPTLKSSEPGMAPAGHHILEIATTCSYQSFKRLYDHDPKAYKAKKRAVYQQVMESVRDLIPDVDKYIRLKLYGTPTTSEYFFGPARRQYLWGEFDSKSGGVKTESAIAQSFLISYLVRASAGYPSVPGVIGSGMNVVELITGHSLADQNSRPKVAVGALS